MLVNEDFHKREPTEESLKDRG